MTTAPIAVQFVDNIFAPEVFSVGPSGFGRVFDNVVITFESLKFNHGDPPGPVSRAVVLRLALPVQAAQGLALGLHDYLVKQGLDPTAAAKGDAIPQ